MTFRKVNFSVMQQGDGNQPHPNGTLIINQDNVLVMHDGTTYGGNVVGAHPFNQTLNTYDNATFNVIYAANELHLNPAVPLNLSDNSGLAGRLDFNNAVELSSKGDIKLSTQWNKTWKFGTDGGLILANGGYVSGESGLSASSTAISTGGSSFGGPNGMFDQSSFTSGSLSSIAPGWIAVDANGLILTITQVNAYNIPGMLVADGNWSQIGPYTFYSSDYVSLSNPVAVKGGLEFEDSTVQTTAYRVVAAPAHSTGASGDTAGMVAYDSNYHYYCKTTYTNGAGNIWVRVAWTGTSW